MKKITITTLVSLLFLSCSVSEPNNSVQNTSSMPHRDFRWSQYAPTGHSSLNFSDLEKEYSSFNTKALSDGYVSRMFNKFLIVTPNPTQVIRQLEFARYLKDVKTDSTYFNSLKTIIAADNNIYTKITTTSGVTQKKSEEPATFGVFVDSLSPSPGVPVATSATEITANSFTANWNSVSGATSYIIVINGVETPLGNVTTYTKSGLTGETSYSYYVKAVNAGGISNNSNTISTTTLSSVITTGLILSLDAGKTASYPGTGTIWTDLTGNGHNATLINGASFNSSYGGGIVFDGVDDYAQYSTEYPMAMTVTTVAKSTNAVWNSSAGLGSARGPNGFIIHPEANSSTLGLYFINSGFQNYPVADYTPSNIQQPNFYTISTNASNVHKVYLNGQLMATNTTTVISRSSSAGSQTCSLALDQYHSQTAVTIYYHSVYNRQLNDSEVLQNYDSLKTRFGL